MIYFQTNTYKITITTGRFQGVKLNIPGREKNYRFSKIFRKLKMENMKNPFYVYYICVEYENLTELSSSTNTINDSYFILQVIPKKQKIIFPHCIILNQPSADRYKYFPNTLYQ